MTTETIENEAFVFDPWDVTWRDDRTVETIDELVERHPVYRLDDTQVVLSRYEDVRGALRDESRFTAKPNQSALIGFPPPIEEGADPELVTKLVEIVGSLPFNVEDFAAADVIVGIDGPTHRRVRNIVNRGFVPRRIEEMGVRVEEIVADCVSGLDGLDEFDLMERIAVPIPIRTVADMLGVPESAQDLKRWSDVLSACVHGEGRGSIQAAIDLVQMLSEFAALFMPLIEERRENPGEDVISDIVRATEEDTLSVAEAVLFLLIIMAAANETTTSVLGNAVPYLRDNPSELQRLRETPELVDKVVEETARLCAPVQFVYRGLLVDDEIAGVELPAGTVCVCMIHAANRDERQYPDPHRFSLSREGVSKSTLAFGYGAHHCLGAALGRLEGRAALTALLPYIDQFDVDRSDLQLDRSAFTRAYERVRMVRVSEGGS